MGRVLLVALAVTCACQGRDDLDGRRRPIPGLGDRGAEYELSAGAGTVAMDLLDNRAAAVVHAGGGLTIECGTADMAKYVEGAYRSRWHLAADDGGERAALVRGLAGELYLPMDRDPGGVARDPDGSVRITLRARAARPQQLVSVFLNEKRLGDIVMSDTTWRTYSIRAPAQAVTDGENKLRFYFRHAGEIDGQSTAAAIQRIRVGSAGAALAPVMRTESVTRADRRLGALRVSQAARISFYVQVPDGQAELLFAAAGQGTSVAVQVASARGTSRLWQGVAADAWSATRVDLGAWAGEVVRIDLVSDGPVDWGRPQIVLLGAWAASTDRPPLADHVIVWVVSALRADRLGGDVPTPSFHRLMARGMRFVHAYTAAPVPAAAHVAMLSGRHPQADVLPDGMTTLAERLSEAGFVTALVSGNGFVHDEAGFAQGFSVYANPMRRRYPFRARGLWQRAKQELQRHKDGRTFLYLVTVEPHLPYAPEPDSQAAEWSRPGMRFAPADTLRLRDEVRARTQTLTRDEQLYIEALYDAEVRDADAAFGEMLADVDSLGIADRTAIILVADHGEELFERGAFGHGEHLHEEVLRVPLVIALPGARGPSVVERDVSLVDLHATVLDLVGLSGGAEHHGVSMLAAATDPVPRPILAHLPGEQRSVKLGRYKLIVPLQGVERLYDLGADPREQRDLMGQSPIIERYLRNVFGIAVAYQTAWSRARWGAPNNTSPAFAADHGL